MARRTTCLLPRWWEPAAAARFEFPETDGKSLLDFDPRGRLLEIVQEGQVKLRVEFPVD